MKCEFVTDIFVAENSTPFLSCCQYMALPRIAVCYNGTMIKKFLMKKMLQSQLKNVPEAQRAQILAMVEKDPKLFEQIAKEIQEETKKGKNQMAATMASSLLRSWGHRQVVVSRRRSSIRMVLFVSNYSIDTLF